MGETRKNQHLYFAASGTQSVVVPDDSHISVFQIDISIATDATYDVKIGATSISKGSLMANSSPIQLFLYDFGKGRETGIKGDNLNITLSEQADVFVAYIIFS